jgi:hypothetical protein
MGPVRKLLAYSFGFAGCLGATISHAENACRNGAGLRPGALYVQSGGQLLELSSFNGMDLRTRYLTLIYASSHADTGGVVAIKQLNEGLVPAGRGDVQAVALDRPAVAERGCTDGQRAATRRGTSVSAREYAHYHSERRQRSDALDLFHFAYRPEGASNCHTTNDSSVGGRDHYLYASSDSEPKYRAAEVEGGGALASVAALIDAVKRVFITPAEASRAMTGEQEKLVSRYTHLRTMLRRYDMARTGPSCVTFRIAADPAVTTTFVSIVDLEDTDPGKYYRPQSTWKIEWLRQQ